MDTISGERFAGHVLAVAPPTASNAATLYAVTIGLDQTDPRFHHGLPVHALITINVHHAALVIPNTAVIRCGDNFFVEVLNPDGHRERVQFTPGKIGDDNTEVLAGLTQGQQVVLIHHLDP